VRASTPRRRSLRSATRYPARRATRTKDATPAAPATLTAVSGRAVAAITAARQASVPPPVARAPSISHAPQTDSARARPAPLTLNARKPASWVPATAVPVFATATRPESDRVSEPATDKTEVRLLDDATLCPWRSRTAPTGSSGESYAAVSAAGLAAATGLGRAKTGAGAPSQPGTGQSCGGAFFRGFFSMAIAETLAGRPGRLTPRMAVSRLVKSQASRARLPHEDVKKRFLG
jgi:hypothetical protein